MNKEIILSFVDAINKQDITLIIEMMSEDFYFLDTYGDKMNKEHMKTGWQVCCDSKKQLDSME